MSMNERYEPQSIESRWQKRWAEARTFAAGRRPEAEKRYVLEMFPYPSGAMHMGHARVYTIGDALARHLRMRGHDVLHPIGFDALGLPAENAAIKDGRHPAERTRENIVAFRAEMKSLGYAFDWDREIVTADPEYYRWNQWFFVKMLEKGIVYRRQGKANWCTGCLTVIANEQVLESDGEQRCERCGSPVVEKVIPEWAFRITAYAEALLEGLDELTEWPERVPRCSATGSARARARRWTSPSPGRPRRSRSSRPASTRSTAARMSSSRRSTPSSRASRDPSGRPRSAPSSSACARPTPRSARGRGRRRRASSPVPRR